MPAIIPVIIAVAAYAAEYITIQTLIMTVVMAVASMAMQLLAPSPKGGANQQNLAQAPDRQANVKQPITAWQYLYGQTRVGGAVTFEHSTDNHQTLHYMLTIAGHSVSEIGTLYLNEYIVPLVDNGDGSWSAVAPTDPDPSIINWAGMLTVWKGLGTDAGDAALLSALETNCPDKWTSSHKQRGRAKVYLKFTYNSNNFKGGFPKVSVVVRGKKVFDPRTLGPAITSSAIGTPGVFTTAAAHGLAIGDEVYVGNHDALGGRGGGLIDGWYVVNTVPTTTTLTLIDCSFPVDVTLGGTGGNITKLAWSPNPVLCIRDYMQDRFVGPNILSTEIDDAGSGIAGANVCEAYVTLASNSQTATADATTNILTLNAAVAWPTGTQVFMTTTGTLPSGLTAGTPYYAINTSAGGISSTVSYQLSDTQVDALTGDVVPLGSAGTGTLTVMRGCSFTADATTHVLTTAYTSVAAPIGGATTTDYTTSAFAYRTGDQVKVATTGTLPAGLSAGTTYYWIANDTQNGRIAASLADAISNTPVAFTDAGTGTHIVYVVAEQAYTCNGVVDTTKLPNAIIPEMLSSMAGKVTWTGGQYVIIPAYYRTPTVTITRSNLIGPINLQTTMARRDLYNKVKGTFIDPTAHWQPNDFPPVSNSAYVTADQGVTLWSNIDLGFTDSSSTAQRLAKLGLETGRRQQTLMISCNLSVLETRVGDVVMIDDPDRFGWVGKTFEIIDWTFSGKDTQQADGGSAPFLGIDMLLRETDAAVYAWTSAEETVSSVSPRTRLANPMVVAPPTGLALASGTAYLYLNSDGTVISPIHATWTAPADAFVTDGGRIELQYRKHGTTPWFPGGFAAGSATSANIIGPQDGTACDVRIRSINTLGAMSDQDGAIWSATVSNYSVIGKLQPPSDITTFSAAQNGNVVVFQWSQVPDLDLGGYEIAFVAQGGLLANATVITDTTRGTSVTTAAVPPGSWTFFIRAVDTTGNYSINAASTTMTVGNTNTVVAGTEQAGDFLGTVNGFVRHWSGKLVPDGIYPWSHYCFIHFLKRAPGLIEFSL